MIRVHALLHLVRAILLSPLPIQSLPTIDNYWQELPQVLLGNSVWDCIQNRAPRQQVRLEERILPRLTMLGQVLHEGTIRALMHGLWTAFSRKGVFT